MNESLYIDTLIYKAWEKVYNKTWLTEKIRKNVDETHAAWLLYRNTYCEFELESDYLGTSAYLESAGCYLKLTREHLEYLETIIKRYYKE